ncbi:MAG: TIGR03086 family metal-binding protein [Microthrixaceae bacterium]
MDTLRLLALATEEFRRRLLDVGEDQWDLPSDCEPWTVTQLVAHVVAGNALAAALAAGASTDDAKVVYAEAEASLDGSAPGGGTATGATVLAAFDRSAADQIEGFDRPGVLERVLHHPAFDMPGEMVLGFRIGDLTVHGWDLARSTGGDLDIRPELVEAVWGQVAPMGDMIAASGMFGDGPSGTVPEDAALQTRLLDLMGRRP